MSSETFKGILVYSEFDGKVGPVVRAHYPETLDTYDLKRLASMKHGFLIRYTQYLLIKTIDKATP